MQTLIHDLSTYGLFLGLPLLFLGIVLWVYRPGAKGSYRADGRLPFDDKDAGHKDDGHPGGAG